MQHEEEARVQVLAAEQALKDAQARAKKGCERLLSLLNELGGKTVTVKALEKSMIGVTVNKLRKHALSAVSAQSEVLVRKWKAVVERSDPALLSSRSSTSVGSSLMAAGKQRLASQHNPRLDAPHSSKGTGQRRAQSSTQGHSAMVLDSVRDDRGRLELRVADLDSHEDQLALSEAALAEQMWEEKMGSASCMSGPATLRRTRSWQNDQDKSPERRPEHATQPVSSEALKREAVSAQIRERYRQIEMHKQERKLVRLDSAPPQAARKRPRDSAASLKERFSK